jgi:hypothetical protein
MTKHTNGPWAFSETGLIGAGPQFLHIAQTVTTGMGHAATANARIIAAAPEMLDALRIALRELENACHQAGANPETDTTCAIIRNTITQATGA